MSEEADSEKKIVMLLCILLQLPLNLNSIVDAYLWPEKYLFTQHTDVYNVFNILR